MVNNEYYNNNKNKENDLTNMQRQLLTKGLSNFVGGLSIYIVWENFIKNSIAYDSIFRNQVIVDCFYKTAMVLLFVIGFACILSIFFNWVRNILYNEKIKAVVDSYTDILLVTQLLMCVFQVFEIDIFSVTFMLIVALLVLIIFMAVSIYVIYSNRALYKSKHVFVIAVLLLFFSVITFWSYNLIYASIVFYIFTVILIKIGIDKYIVESSLRVKE
jgi:hypothetical protein